MAKHARMEVDRDREALRAEVLAVDEAREVTDATTASEEVQTLQKKKRNIRFTRSMYVKF
jgi:hypothetical protein